MLLLEFKSKFRHGNKTSSKSPKEHHLEDMPIPVKIVEIMPYIKNVLHNNLVGIYNFTLSFSISAKRPLEQRKCMTLNVLSPYVSRCETCLSPSRMLLPLLPFSCPFKVKTA